MSTVAVSERDIETEIRAPGLLHTLQQTVADPGLFTDQGFRISI